MASTELIDGLNHALNREVSTFLRYMVQGASIKGSRWETVRELYLSEVSDEVGHAQYLANKICALGATPKIDPDLPSPPAKPEAMLENDIKEEEEDVKHYLRLAELASGEGLADLKVQMEEQAADEARHAEEMRRQLG